MPDVPARIAVFGAGGFLGSHLVEALLERTEAEVRAIDLTFDKLQTSSPRLETTAGSVTDATLVSRVVGDADVVLSLTALCNPALYNTRPLEVIDASYAELVPLVSACAEQRRWLVHFSTCEVYGRRAVDADGRPTTAMSETESALVLGPVQSERWTYAAAKQLLERRIWALGKHGGLTFTIVRPFNVIGPRMDFIPGVDGEGVPRVLASFMHALMAGRPMPLVDGGEQRRAFIAVEDFVDAVMSLLARSDACAGHILNIGNPDNDVSIAALARILGRIFAVRVQDSVPPATERVAAMDLYGDGYADSVERIPDISLASRLLEWEPRIPLVETLPGIVDDYVRRYGDAVAKR